MRPLIKIVLDNGNHQIDVKGNFSAVISELTTMFYMNPKLVEPFELALQVYNNAKPGIDRKLKKLEEEKKENGESK